MKILITGGASGLGEVITRKLAENDSYFVNFTYCKSAKNAESIESEFKNTRAFYCDFSDDAGLAEFAEKIDSMDIDVLVNNAVTGLIKKHFHKTEPPEYYRSFHNNVLPVIIITSEALKLFRKKKSGRIINILSIYTLGIPPAGLSEYSANKAYILSLSNSWAAENGKLGVISNCISPDIMAAGLNRDTDERILQELAKNSKTGKLLTTGETAEAVKYLLTADAVITGRNIEVKPGVNIGTQIKI